MNTKMFEQEVRDIIQSPQRQQVVGLVMNKTIEKHQFDFIESKDKMFVTAAVGSAYRDGFPVHMIDDLPLVIDACKSMTVRELRSCAESWVDKHDLLVKFVKLFEPENHTTIPIGDCMTTAKWCDMYAESLNGLTLTHRGIEYQKRLNERNNIAREVQRHYDNFLILNKDKV